MYTCPYTRKEYRYGPPAGWVMPATEQFNSAEQWPQLVARGLHFPDHDGPSDLCVTRGACLVPLLVNQVYRTRPVAHNELLIDGGLYIFECDWKDKDDPEKVAAYCAEMGVLMGPKNVVMKFLRFACLEWWYVCNQGVGKLSDLPGLSVLAVVVGLGTLAGCNSEVAGRQAPCGNPFDALSVVCNDTGQIGANAVSSMASNYSAALVSTNNNVTQGTGSSTDANVITASVTTIGSPMAIDVGCTVTLTGGGTPGSSFTSGVLDVFMDGASVGSAKWDGTNLANFGGGGAPPAIQVTLSATNAPSPGAHTYALHAHVAGTGTAWSCTIGCVNNFIKVREIKR